ncbi:SPW repeat protein [Dactylosporangium sp. NPDC051541]|uniref:SPW repeat protein n=1 Tax=Dactylosporangium sp. NPDC051541 TaxID=3363977 RepID=UPI003790A264
MVRPIADLEGHPDIAELRARYDQVSETPAARITDGVLVLAGLYLALSPWVVGFPPFEANLSVNNFICGIAVAVLAGGFAVAYGRTHGLAWLPVAIGVWTIVAPFVVQRGYSSGGAIASNIVIGIVTIGLGLVAMRPGMMARRR